MVGGVASVVVAEPAETLPNKAGGGEAATISQTEGLTDGRTDGDRIRSGWQPFISALGGTIASRGGVETGGIGNAASEGVAALSADSLLPGQARSRASSFNKTSDTSADVAGRNGETKEARRRSRDNLSSESSSQSTGKLVAKGTSAGPLVHRTTASRGRSQSSNSEEAKQPGSILTDAGVQTAASVHLPPSLAGFAGSFVRTDSLATDRMTASLVESVSGFQSHPPASANRQNGTRSQSNVGLQNLRRTSLEGEGTKRAEGVAQNPLPVANNLEPATGGGADSERPAQLQKAGASPVPLLEDQAPAAKPQDRKSLLDQEGQGTASAVSKDGIQISGSRLDSADSSLDLATGERAQLGNRASASARLWSAKAPGSQAAKVSAVDGTHGGDSLRAGGLSQTRETEPTLTASENGTPDPPEARTSGLAGAGGGSVSTETFSALDGAAGPTPPIQVHGGARHAEAGFQDPTLGWVGVRADLSSSGGIHAELVPDSAASAQVLKGDMPGIHAYLTEHHSPVETLTMAALDSRSDSNGDQSGQSGSGQEHGRRPGPNPLSNSGSGAAASSGPEVRASATYEVVPVPRQGTRQGGMHISVMA